MRNFILQYEENIWLQKVRGMNFMVKTWKNKDKKKKYVIDWSNIDILIGEVKKKFGIIKVSQILFRKLLTWLKEGRFDHSFIKIFLWC